MVAQWQGSHVMIRRLCVQVLGFILFLLLSFPTFLQQWSVLNLVPQVCASQIVLRNQ